MSDGENYKWLIYAPMVVDEYLLDTYELRVYFHIARRAGRSGSFWGSIENVARHCMISTRKAIGCFNSLCKFGFLKKTQERPGYSSMYQLQPPEEWLPAEEVTEITGRSRKPPIQAPQGTLCMGVVNDVQGGGAPGAHKGNNKRNDLKGVYVAPAPDRDVDCESATAPLGSPTADVVAEKEENKPSIGQLKQKLRSLGVEINNAISKLVDNSDPWNVAEAIATLSDKRHEVQSPSGFFTGVLRKLENRTKETPEQQPNSEASRTSEKAKHDSFPIFTSEFALMSHLGLTSASKYKDMEPNLTAIASEEVERLPAGLPIFQSGLSSPWVLMGRKPPQNEFSSPQFLFRQIGKPKQSPSTCSVRDLRLVKQIPWQGPIESNPTNQGYCYGVFRSESEQIAILCHVEGDRISPIELPEGLSHVGFATINVSIVTQLVAA